LVSATEAWSFPRGSAPRSAAQAKLLERLDALEHEMELATKQIVPPKSPPSTMWPERAPFVPITREHGLGQRDDVLSVARITEARR
jgi:hypothetical protein